MTRAYVSMILTISLASNSASAVNSIGIVSHADRAHLGAGSASAGTTLYEGDRLTTDFDGELALRSGSVALQLEQETSLTLGNLAPGEKGVAADLISGTLVFSTAGASSVVVRANGATIRTADDAPMIAHVRVVGPNELRIFAQRGALDFSYREEQEQITEGACYRVLLNAGEEDPANSGAAGAHGKNFALAHKAFVFIAIGIGASAAAAVEKSHHPHPHPHESPERP